jgi:hypothetical protein
MENELASIKALAIHSEHPYEGTFHTLVSDSEALERSLEKTNITIPVNACHTWAIEQLLNPGFRVERLAVHMVLEGTDLGPVINCWVNCLAGQDKIRGKIFNQN